MLNQLLNSPTVDYLSRGMSAANLRQEVIGNNIANVNTPRFKKSDVVFESLLAKEMGLEDDSHKLKMVRTQDKHLGEAEPGRAYVRVEIQEDTTMRTDKNNVDIDKEMAELAKNQLYFSAMAKQMGGYFQKVKDILQSR